MFERLYDMSILDFQPVTLDMSGKYLGFTLAMWHDSYPNSSLNPIQNVFSYWLNPAYVSGSNVNQKIWTKFGQNFVGMLFGKWYCSDVGDTFTGDMTHYVM